MNELQLIKSEHFGEIDADIYSNGEDMFMTISQLAACLEYADKGGVERIIERNPYLREPEFSYIQKVPHSLGGTQKTRTFTEDGIYEITMLSGQPKAQLFHGWIRKILKALRRGQIVSAKNIEAERVAAQRERSKAMLLNAQTNAYKTIMKTIDDKKLSPIAAEVFGIAALEQVTGKRIDYRLACDRTYSATEIALECGVSANKVGKTANANHLKTEEYGITILDTAAKSGKAVPNFRYNEKGRERLLELLKG